MIKDRIIELENGTNYYVLDDIAYNESKFILASECNLEKDTIDKDKYIVLEIKINNNQLYISNIEDDNLAATITTLLLKKVRAEVI